MAELTPFGVDILRRSRRPPTARVTSGETAAEPNCLSLRLPNPPRSRLPNPRAITKHLLRAGNLRTKETNETKVLGSLTRPRASGQPAWPSPCPWTVPPSSRSLLVVIIVFTANIQPRRGDGPLFCGHYTMPMSETDDYVLDCIKTWVWSGFYGPDDI